MGLLGRWIAAIFKPHKPGGFPVSAGVPLQEAPPTGASPTAEPPPEEPGLILLKHYESCAKRTPEGTFAPYLDGGGIPTIGWGNTFYENGSRVKMTDQPISQEQADALLQIIWGTFRKRVAALLPQDFPQRETGVLTCFAYNVGIETFRKSTALAYANHPHRNMDLCAKAMEWYNMDEGLVVRGLQKRRRAERLTLLGDDPYSAIAQAERDFQKPLR